MTQSDWIRAISDAAAAWRDPDYPARADAVRATLEVPNRFTEEGLAFVLNHLSHQLRPGVLREGLHKHTASTPRTVGVVASDDLPLSGTPAVLAALLLGHRPVVSPSLTSPSLLPAFIASVEAMAGAKAVRLASLDGLFAEAEALVAWAAEEAFDDLAERADAAGIPAERRWMQRHGVAVAVIDGTEDASDRSGLAEDLLLHEGIGPRATKMVWAPAGESPDALLDTLAGFRELYPAHSDTDGALRMPTAFLTSTKQSHATGPGFLLSKGAPEPQGPAHVRWAEYETLQDVATWIREHRDVLDFVVATDRIGTRLETDVPIVAPGDAHRSELWQPGLIPFLAAL